MASGTIQLTRNATGVFLLGQIVWESTSNGTEANTSTVTATLQLQRYALNTTTGTFKGTFTVGGTSETISWYGSLPSKTWVTVKTITTTVSHNADGAGNCYLYALINGPSATTMEGTYVSGSATVTLDTIPRYADIISSTDFTDESNPTITYSNPAGNAVSSLQACISLDGSDDDVSYRDIPKTGTKYTFSLTETERNILRAATPNSNTLQVKVFVRSKIGSVDKAYYVTSKMMIVNATPVVSTTVVDTNEAIKEVTADPSILVAGHSTAKVTVDATAQKYATIKSKKAEHGTQVLTGDGTLSVTNNPIKITVTDSRGNSATQNATNVIVPYINPTCLIGNKIPDADGAFLLEVSGKYYNGTIGKTENNLAIQYRYKAAGGSYGDWVTFESVSKSGNSYTATASLSGLDYQTVYIFQARVMDALHASGVYAADKSVIAEPVFDWGQYDFKFNVPVNLKDGCDIRKNGKKAYAPDGYGLGSSARSVNDLNNATESGWYAFSVDAANRPFDYGVAMTIDRYGGRKVQIAFNPFMNGDGEICIRSHGESEWLSWEYCNPPLYPGVEYRTTRRYYGEPVYMKLIDIGELPKSSGKSVAHGISGCRPIRCTARAKDSTATIPYVSTGGAHISVAASASTIQIYSSYDHDNGSGTVEVLLEYYKV